MPYCTSWIKLGGPLFVPAGETNQPVHNRVPRVQKKNMQCIKSLQPSTSLLLASPLLYSPTGSLPCAGMEAHITIRPLKPMP